METFQLSLETAEAYEARFVPALFGEWAPHLADAAAIEPGQVVLDVACGTGVVAREVADRVGPKGAVVGVDLNEAMLTVAGRHRPEVEWRQGDAADLPFPDASFDAVLCQASLMFFPDRAAALREMARVTRPGGRVVVHVWASLDDQPAYGPFVAAAARHAGDDAVDLLGAYWALGDLDVVESLFAAADLREISVDTRVGTAHFDSVDELVATEVNSTPLGDRIDADVYAKILDDSRQALAPFLTTGDRLEAPIVGHIVSARR